MRKIYLLTALAIFIVSGSLLAQNHIAAKDARKHIGEKVSVRGKVSKSELRQTGNKKTTVLNIEGDDNLTIIINDESRKNFPYKPEEYYTHKNVSVTGKVVDAKGRSEIAVFKPEDIKVDQPTGGGQIEIKPMDINGITRYFDKDF